MWGGLVIEFELLTNQTDCIVSFVDGTGAATSSTTWQITNINAVCDVVTLDSALQNSYAEHVLSGKALPVNFNSYITMLQSTGGSQNINVNIARAVSRLKTIFLTYDCTARDATNAGFNANQQLVAKDFNTFYHPMQGNYNFNLEFQYQVKIGGKFIPEYPVKSTSQSFLN